MNQIRWRCRRSRRELELLLYRFLDEKYEILSEHDKQIFKLLLDQNDPDLLSWLVGRSSPEEETLRRVVDEIRTAIPTLSYLCVTGQGEGGDWKQFLREVGAHFAEGRVRDFGHPPEFEQAQALQGNIVADLSHYGLIQVSGRDAQSFLAAQFTSDVRLVSDSYSQLSAWCTPKGRVRVVFRIFRQADAYYLLLPRECLDLTLQRLCMYILRSQVTLEDACNALVRIGLSGPAIGEQIGTLLGEPPTRPNEARLIRDSTVVRIPGLHPRFLVIGTMEVVRDLWLRLQNPTPVGAGAWTLLEIMAGIPTVVPCTSEIFLPQMLNLEALGGLSFTKGCYPGQEVIARVKYRGQLKRRMYLALADTDLVPAPGESLFSHRAEDGQSIGQVVAAAPYPKGRTALLAVVEISAAEQGNVCLYHPEGPLLTFQALPPSF